VELFKNDSLSFRSFLADEIPKQQLVGSLTLDQLNTVIDWLEAVTSGTGVFSLQSVSEVVLEGYKFHNEELKEWRRIGGGSSRLPLAMKELLIKNK
jgi:hypothetical protein